MKKTIDQLSTLLEHNNIALPQGAKKFDAGQPTKYHERCLSLKSSLTLLKDYLIYSLASNHIVSSRESFTTFTLSGGPITHMGDESQIPDVGRGLVKFQHDKFKIVLYMPSPAGTKKIVQDE